MKLIPALDLMGGLVVHAQGGVRQQYRPLHTRHFPDATPIKVLSEILKRLDTRIIYLADLDAINRVGSQRDLIATISRHFPQLALWVDVGIREYADLTALKLPRTAVAVVGSETFRGDLRALANTAYILSLDFKDGRLLGGDAFLQSGDWPQRTIALSLDRVGSRQGPDIACLKKLRSRYRGKLYAGGGIRHQDDLNALAAIGISGALVADALYRNTLNTNSAHHSPSAARDDSLLSSK